MNFRLTIILAVVLLIIGGVVYLGQQGRNTSSVGGEERPFVYRLDADRINRLSVEHLGTKIGFVSVGTVWVFDDAEQTATFADRFGGLKYILAGPRADRVLDGELDNAAEYGLDPPQSKVTIIETGGRSIVLHFGDLNADQTNQYVSLEGSTDVFMIHESWTTLLTRLVTEPPYEPTLEPLPEEFLTPTPDESLTPTPTP
jgi:hypothetical protein